MEYMRKERYDTNRKMFKKKKTKTKTIAEKI